MNKSSLKPIPHKKIKYNFNLNKLESLILLPTCFSNGSICGHNIKFRNVLDNEYVYSYNIPKVKPVPIKLKDIDSQLTK